jgi:hypothetical protein
MSYDLFFQFRDSEEPLDAFAKYFAPRPNYTLRPGQAWYSNQDTGVYFSFEWKTPSEKAKEDDRHAAVFNLNYSRPHPFALEAEPEVAAFVTRFNLSVEDPQIDGISSDAYSREDFLRGWNAGNKVACEAAFNSPSQSAVDLTLPTESIEKYWSWSMARRSLQSQLGENVFVPVIMFCIYQKQLQTFVSWTDAIPIALPAVDLLCLNRNQKRLLIFNTTSIAIAPYKSLTPHVESFPIKEGAIPYRLLSYCERPESLIKYFNDQPIVQERPELISFDRIINRELMQLPKSN